MTESVQPPHPGFAEATRLWAKIGLLSFGGPAGQIALMHRELVEQRRWISESRFLHALNFCMLLPGPEAQQLATYIGWLLHGTLGGLVAGTLFVLPGFLTILVLSATYALFHQLAWLAALFFGLKAAVLAIVVEALLRVGRRALKNNVLVGLAIGAFLALFVFGLPFPVVVLAAGAIGYFGSRTRPELFGPGGARTAGADAAAVIGDDYREPRVRPVQSLRTLLVGALLWAAPLALVGQLFGGTSIFASIWVFFSQMAVVTFGGAYAVLAYVAQQAVQGFGWLQPGEMVDGLALAETTPGPLVLVLSFVGFLAAFKAQSGMSPLLAGILGASLTTWVTFVPCFIWIFLGAPYVERLRTNKALSGALSAITAAVVGVILNLAVWFALHVLFHQVGTTRWGPASIPTPAWSTLDLAAAALALIALLCLFRLRLGLLPTLALCGAGGLLLNLAGWSTV
jgi:chromate transporter